MNILLFNFRLAVYDGLRQLGPLKGGIRTCGIVACTINQRHTCADRSQVLKPAQFDSIKISATLPADDKVLYFPSTLQTSLTPVSTYMYCNEKLNSKQTKIDMETVFDEESLLAFGFYGRVYERDVYLTDGRYEKLSGDEWMKIYIVSVAAAIIASVGFIFYAQRTDLKLKIT